MKSWSELIRAEKEKPYYADRLAPFLEKEYRTSTIYPEIGNIYRALELTPLRGKSRHIRAGSLP